MKKIIYILLLGLLCPILGISQGGNNPFELTPRLPIPTQQRIESEGASAYELENTNPFEIGVKDTVETEKIAPVVIEQEQENLYIQPTEQKSQKSFYFTLTIIGLVLFTLALTLFRGQLSTVIRALRNSNVLSLAFRKRESEGLLLSFVFLYFFFFFNLAFFVYLIIDNLATPIEAPLYTYSLFLGGSIGLFLLKHIVLSVTGAIFPIEKELSLYSFTIMLAAILLGIILYPLCVMIAFLPPGMINLFIGLGILSAIILYGLKVLRGLFIANRVIIFHKFHFLLYLCTVEIAPALIFYKLVNNQLM